MGWLTRLFKQPVYPRETKIITEYAFTIGGIDYFCCNDFLNMPPARAEKANIFYEELKANVDYDYLEWITNEIEDCVNKGKLGNIAILNGLLKERLSLAPDPQLLLKLATVVFFDAKEDIYDYDFKYNEGKRDLFKKEGLDAFFLKMPLEKLIPHLDLSKADSTMMKEAVTATSAKTVQLMDNLLAGGSTKNLTESSKSKLQSVRQQALEYLTLEGLDYTNIIYSLNSLNNKTGPKSK